MLGRTTSCAAIACALAFALTTTFAHADTNAPRKPQTRSKPAKPNKNGIEKPSYMWVDENGVAHYGDRVPPEYVKRERRVLNSQGVEVARIEAQKTPEQLAEDRRRQDLAARQGQHDKFLLTTYTSTRDIELLRDTRLSQVGDQRKSTETYLESLHERLAALQLQAQAYRPYNESPDAKPMPDRLADNLVRTMNETRTQRALLAARRNEEQTLRDQFQADIDRYRALRSGVAASR